jgi:hypothetical protein
MRYELKVTAYDVLDQVHISVILRSSENDPESKPHTELQYVTTYAGEGITDPGAWVRDTLVAALEAL